MSTINVTNLSGRGGGTPNLPDGAVISGVATVTNLKPTNVNVSGAVTATTFDGSLKSTGTPTLGLGVTINSSGVHVSGICTAGTCFKAGNGAFGPGIGVTILGSGDAVLAGVVTATQFVPTVGQLSNRNLMINGAMQVAQRGITTSVTSSYACDRYRLTFTNTDEAATIAQVALTSSDTGPWGVGFRYASQITNGNQTSGAGAADNVFMKYKYEAQDLAQSGWDYTSSSSYVTLSFWVKSSVAQNFYGWIVTDDGTQQNYPFETGSLTADTWTKITKAIPGNSNITMTNDNSAGLALHLVAFQGTDYTASGVALDTWAAYASGTRTPDFTSTWYTTNDSTFAFTGFQLEVGSVATPFEHRTYADDLIKCQRYFQIFGGDVNYSAFGTGGWKTTTQAGCHLNLMSEMRSAPSMTVVDPTDSSVRSGAANVTTTTVVLDIASPKVIMYNCNASSGGTAGHGALHYSAGNHTQTLSFSAEL